MSTSTSPAVKRAATIPTTGSPAALDRYLLDSAETAGAVALVEHVLAPGVLAAPVHRHHREDEFSLVLAGRLAVWEEGRLTYAEAGDLVPKSRGRWHTFWNGGDAELRVLEVITPGGIEALFRKLAEPGGEYDPDSLPALAAAYGCDVDFEATMPLVEEHRLTFAD